MIPQEIVAMLFLMYRRVPQLLFGNCLTTHYATILCIIYNQINPCLPWSSQSGIQTRGLLVSRLCAIQLSYNVINNVVTLVKSINIKGKWRLHATTTKKMEQRIGQDLKKSIEINRISQQKFHQIQTHPWRETADKLRQATTHIQPAIRQTPTTLHQSPQTIRQAPTIIQYEELWPQEH